MEAGEASDSNNEYRKWPLTRLKAAVGMVSNWVEARVENAKKLGKDDPRRVTHSLKVGLALTLVSLLYYVRPLYDGFGASGIWAVLTVVFVFEFTVGGTLSKGLNRGFATLLAGALGVGAAYFARLFGERGEPVVLGLTVFLLGAAATFSRFFPRIKKRYDYGVLIFILTFSLVAVSGYRVEEIVVLSHQRLSTIWIGGVVCISISIFIRPVWAGEDLHKLLVSNIDKLANYLEAFADEFFAAQKSNETDHTDSKDGYKHFLQGYKSVLSSKNSEETLENLARWEPGHGRFNFRHPWKQYLNIGAHVRQCAYQIEALNGHLNSNFKASLEFLTKIQEPCTTMSTECGMALKALSSSIKEMSDPSSANGHVEASKSATKGLRLALKAATPCTNEELLMVLPGATVASILIEIVKCVEKISESVHELSDLAGFKGGADAIVSPKTGQPHHLHRGSIKPVSDGETVSHVAITINETASDLPEKKT